MSGYLVTVTTVKRRDRGRKTIELKTFEYDKPNRRWVYHPGRLGPTTVRRGLGRFGSRAKPDSQTAKAAGNTRPPGLSEDR